MDCCGQLTLSFERFYSGMCREELRVLGQKPVYPRCPSATLSKCILSGCCFVFCLQWFCSILTQSYNMVCTQMCSTSFNLFLSFNWSFYILRQESITLEKNMLLLNLKFWFRAALRQIVINCLALQLTTLIVFVFECFRVYRDLLFSSVNSLMKTDDWDKNKKWAGTNRGLKTDWLLNWFAIISL